MDFGVIPGMGCWNEMPKKYKEAYFKCKNKDKPLSLYKKNQLELDKIWLKEIKKENLKEDEWLNWME